MKLALVLSLALASQLSAQVTSQQRIPVRKQHQTPVDTVVIRLVDTVLVLRTDTLYIAAGAVAPLATFDTLMRRDTVPCGKGIIPIPIPIPDRSLLAGVDGAGAGECVARRHRLSGHWVCLGTETQTEIANYRGWPHTRLFAAGYAHGARHR